VSDAKSSPMEMKKGRGAHLDAGRDAEGNEAQCLAQFECRLQNVRARAQILLCLYNIFVPDQRIR
jgi:hypothetical protein